jgi:hypothetical protein
MGTLEILHDILIAGPDFESCRRYVERFFARTMLVRYDEVACRESDSVNGVGEDFWATIAEGIKVNREILGKFLANLKEEGFETLDDLQGLEKGYLSKMLHLIAHLQDGFIGIDSRFYNLEEDSHGVSRDLQQKMQASPHKYWILRVTGRIASTEEDPFDALRTFEGRGNHSV